MTKKDIINQVHALNYYYASKGFTKNYSKQWFSHKYNTNMLLVAYDSTLENILGFVCAHKMKDMPNHINLVILCVQKDHLRKGVGTQLINQFKEHFKNKIIALNVNKKNLNAVSFYESMKFEKLKEYEESMVLIKK